MKMSYAASIVKTEADPPHSRIATQAENIETENWKGCARQRKSAWTRRKRRDPEGINPRGLALNKNR
jgi:hypothetical protein